MSNANIDKDIISAVTLQPGMSSRQIVELTGASRHVALMRLTTLTRAGKVERTLTPRPKGVRGRRTEYTYYPATSGKKVERTVIAPRPKVEATTGGFLDVSRELAELRKFKADAIAKYPDLSPVDPKLLKARELATEALGGGRVPADDAPIIKALLKALDETV